MSQPGYLADCFGASTSFNTLALVCPWSVKKNKSQHSFGKLYSRTKSNINWQLNQILEVFWVLTFKKRIYGPGIGPVYWLGYQYPTLLVLSCSTTSSWLELIQPWQALTQAQIIKSLPPTGEISNSWLWPTPTQVIAGFLGINQQMGVWLLKYIS